MPFNFGQLFTENPYENQFNPETGIRKKPSLIQRLAYPKEADRISLENYQQNVLAGTDKPLASNPAYRLKEEGDAGFVDAAGNVADLATEKIARKAGVTNPFLRPSAATAFFHPETMKMWNQFQNAPAENQLEIDRQAALSSGMIDREVQGLRATAPIHQANAVAMQGALAPGRLDEAKKTYEAMTPLELDRMKQASAQVEKTKIDQVVSTLTQLDAKGLIPKQLHGLDYKTIAYAANGNPAIENLIRQATAAAGISHNLIELDAVAAGMSKRLQANKDELENVGVVAGLGMKDSAKRTAENNMRQAEFTSAFGVPLNAAATTPKFTRPNADGTTTLVDNTASYDPVQFERDRQMKSFNAKNAMASGIGIVPEQGAPVRYYGEQSQGGQRPAAPPIARPPQASMVAPVKRLAEPTGFSSIDAEEKQELTDINSRHEIARQATGDTYVKNLATQRKTFDFNVAKKIEILEYEIDQIIETSKHPGSDLSSPITRANAIRIIQNQIKDLKKQHSSYYE